MPLINELDQVFPDWCEVRSFEIFRMAAGDMASIEPKELKSILIVGRGEVVAKEETLGMGDIMHFTTSAITLAAGSAGATAIVVNGHWGDDFGGIGIFGAREVVNPIDNGDPIGYPKATSFDAHYHDCDEYWIVFEGRGTAVSEGIEYDVSPGDCIATGMGHHHDFPRVSDPVQAVFFETTLQGEKRRGHLWNHTHGPATPQPNRV